METSLQPRYRDRYEIADLVERCKMGDQSAYKTLYDKYIHAMYNTSFRILDQAADAEDAVQEAFTQAFRNIRNFDGRSTFGYWLKRIVVNKSINLIRARKLDLIGVDELQLVEDQHGLENNVQAYHLEQVIRAIQQLPAGYRTVLSLYLIEGYDHQEIAQILNVAESTTRTQYIRAKKKLRHLLNTNEV